MCIQQFRITISIFLRTIYRKHRSRTIEQNANIIIIIIVLRLMSNIAYTLAQRSNKSVNFVGLPLRFSRKVSSNVDRITRLVQCMFGKESWTKMPLIFSGQFCCPGCWLGTMNIRIRSTIRSFVYYSHRKSSCYLFAFSSNNIMLLFRMKFNGGLMLKGDRRNNNDKPNEKWAHRWIWNWF